LKTVMRTNAITSQIATFLMRLFKQSPCALGAPPRLILNY
jgi:hypothetical protein